MLSTLTSGKIDKVRSTMPLLGMPEEKRIYDSSQRGLLCKFFCALGTAYQPISIELLQAGYHSLGDRDAGVEHLWPLVANNSEDARELRNRYFQIIAGHTISTVTKETPIDKATITTIGQPKQQDQSMELAQQIAALLTGASKNKSEINEARVVELIKQHSQATEIRIKTPKEDIKIPTGLHHYILPDVLVSLKAGLNVYLVGQAGAGKTTLAMQLAKVLEVPFHFNGALDSEYKLTGFIDATGKYIRTAFREAYEHGGLYLFDEIDASAASALLAFNAALENGHSDFPDGCIKMHKNFYCIAAANTYGLGADRIYIGRNQLDGAFLDRFAFIEMGYDEKLERTIAANDQWVDKVQGIRRAVKSLKIRHIVSPRASIKGAALLAAGMRQDKVEDILIWKGLDEDSISKIKKAA